MSNANQKSVMIVIILVLIVTIGWQGYEMQQKRQAQLEELQAVQAEVAALKEEVAGLEAEITELNKTSVKGMVRDANKAILSGWETLVDTVEEELNKTREAFEQDEPSEHSGESQSPAEKPEDGQKGKPSDRKYST